MAAPYGGWIDPRIGRKLCTAFGVGQRDLTTLMAAMREAVLDEETGVVVGPQGPQGPAGKSLHTGFGPPQDGLGIEEDTYVDVNTGEVYVKG